MPEKNIRNFTCLVLNEIVNRTLYHKNRTVRSNTRLLATLLLSDAHEVNLNEGHKSVA